ncbi:C25 family cysteine peptidase [Flavobacteriales bacterium]|nr:C25 family cysteine peptidase [Flavobacteriales bacterium]
MALTFLFGILAPAAAQNATLISDDAEGIVIRFDFSDPILNEVDTDMGEAIVPRVLGDTPLLRVGAPDVSKVDATVIIDAASGTALEVIDVEFQDIPNVEVAPSKGNLYRNVTPADVPFEQGAVYGQDQFYPAQVASLQSPFVQRGVRGQSVWAFPFQYNAVTNVLRSHSSITVRIVNNETAAVNPAVAPVRVTAEFADQLGRRFLNASSGDSRYDYIEEHGKLIVVTDAMYDDVLAPLVQWKREKGLTTEVIYAADFGDDYNAIKDYLSDAYFSEGLTHVILAGDEDQVPATLVSNGGGDGYCDPCYSFVEGNDHYPEFFVGRLLVHNVAEMQTLVDRTLEYEKNPFLGEEWFNVGVGIGSNEGAGIGDNNESDWQHQNVIKDKLLDYGFQEVWELYDGNQTGNSPTGGETADEGGSPNANDMVQLVNKGLSFINYTGHGYHGGIASSGFDVNAIAQTTNAGMYGFFVPVACCVGDFDEGEGSGDCFGEIWIKQTNNGAPAGGIGGAFSSVLQSWAPPMRGQDEMVDLVVEDGEVDIKHTFGSIVSHGCAGMIDSYGGGGEEMMDTWCIFGDPSVVMRTAFPSQLNLSHQEVYFLGTPTIEVSCPTEGALIALTIGDQILGTAFVENGMATIALDAPLGVPGDYLLTGTAYNTIPYQSVVQAVPAEGPYVLSSGNAAFDMAGDADGNVDQGESIDLELDLSNVGIETAMDVQVTITTADAWVNITTGSVSAGDITADASLTLPGFAYDVVAGVEDQHVAVFDVEIADADGNVWNTSFSTVLNAPHFTVLDLAVEDGGNGILESGETATLTFTIINDGHDAAPGGLGLLDFEHPDVTMFNNGDYVMEDIEPGATFTQGYGVEVSEDAAPGGLLPMTFTFNTFGPDEQDLYLTSADFFEPINLIMETWESGDDATFPWAYDGNEDWFVTDNNPYQGDFCMESGDIGDNQSTALTIALEFLGDGELSFARRVSTEDGWDYLRMYIDGAMVAEWSGEQDWAEEAFELTAGFHTITWSYEKDNIISGGADACWVDDIVLPPFCFIEATITQSGPQGILCPGESVTLTTEGGYTADWSNGASGSSIDVEEAGTYTVTLTDDAGCSFTSDAVVIDVLEPVAPEVTMVGQLGFCEGGSVLLSGPDGGTWDWNVGLENQTIEVSTSGTYQLTFTDACNQANVGEEIEVSVYPIPEAPSTEDFTIVDPADVTLNATGDNLLWYENEGDIVPFGAGPDVTTYVGATTTFWVESESANPGTEGTGGKDVRDDENGQHHQNSGFWLVFDAYQNLNLESVKVYANGAGNRTIALVNANGAELESVTVNVPDGESVVELGFFVPAGAGYGLRSADDNPQLWRDGIGSDPDYPYALSDFGAITGTSVNGGNALNYYYFFYDWKVSVDAVGCSSARVPLTVTVTNPVGVGEIVGLNAVEAYPNPTAGQLFLDLDLGANVLDLNVAILDLQGRTVQATNWSGQATGRRTLDLADLAPGHYTVRLTDGTGQWRLPVVRH